MIEATPCVHNARTRYTTGFHCNDCNTFFSKDSPTYRSGELISSLGMVLHNINAELGRAGKEYDQEVLAMRDRVGIGVKHDDYEGLIADAMVVIRKHGKDEESASTTLGGK